jgi:hypothetical protein
LLSGIVRAISGKADLTQACQIDERSDMPDVTEDDCGGGDAVEHPPSINATVVTIRIFLF